MVGGADITAYDGKIRATVILRVIDRPMRGQ
jgi:hypothetical protein